MFTNTTVLLTGVGGEGQVGEAVARAFAADGASLILVDHDGAKAEARAAAIATGGGAPVRGYGCNLADEHDVAALVTRVRRDHGDELRALVHMAGGFALSGPVAESAVDVWDRQLSINLTTAYLTSRAFLPMLRKGKGALVFFASEAVLPGASGANVAAYAVAKSGVAALMRAIAAEEKQHGVRANAVAPTAIRTAANVAAMGENQPYVEREQVAQVVTYLCSDEASAITGTLIPLR